MKVKIGQHKELSAALRKKRRSNTKAWAAKQIGIGVKTYSKLEDLNGNTNAITQFLARNWVNDK